MSMADIKAAARAAIHERAAEPCIHTRGADIVPTAEQLAAGLILSVRFKMKMKLASAESDGVSILENIESVIFRQTQLDDLGLSLNHNDEIAIPGYGITFILDQEMDGDGPQNVYWTVVRE